MVLMSSVTEVFDSLAEDYDKWFDSPEGMVLFKMEVEAVRLLTKDLKSPSLEIGVGTGRFAKELRIGFGVDPSIKVLEIAEERGINVAKAKGENLPFRDNSFGAVFLLFTLCFVEDQERVFSNVERVLRPGGGFIVGIINRESPWGQIYLKKKAENHPIYKYARFYSIDEVLIMMKNSGMTVEAYSSTLCQPPPGRLYKEVAHNKLVEGAGFVCIFVKKNSKRIPLSGR